MRAWRAVVAIARARIEAAAPSSTAATRRSRGFSRRTATAAQLTAALAGFDQGEFVTIPALPDAGQWETYEAARQALMPNLSHAAPAGRYGVAREAA